MARATTWILAAASVVLFGCGGSTVHVGLTALEGPPRSSLDGDHLQLAAGTALIVDAQPTDDDGEVLTSAVKVVADAPFEVFSTSAKNRFVFSAETAGHARIRILVDGDVVRTLSADALQ